MTCTPSKRRWYASIQRGRPRPSFGGLVVVAIVHAMASCTHASEPMSRGTSEEGAEGSDDLANQVVPDAEPSAPDDPDSGPTPARGGQAGEQRAPSTWVDAGAPASPSAADAGAEANQEGHPDRGFAVGTLRLELMTPHGRTLPLQLWYPADEQARDEASAGHPIQEFEPEGPNRELLDELLETAPDGCTSRTMHAAFEARPNPRAAPYPLIVTSHHFEGMRFALFGVAERLASLGFVVAAPDHVDGTIFDRPGPYLTALNLGFLAVRATDMRDVLDVMLAPDSDILPAWLRGRIDTTRVGMFGHSFGSMTTGAVVAQDSRVKAAAFLSFPPGDFLGAFNVLLGMSPLSEIAVPALFMSNREDFLTQVYDLDGIRKQFEAYSAAAWLVEVSDTGHWSFADDCALAPDFANGCGMEDRQTKPGETYTNLDNARAREIAVRYVSAFFANQLLGADGAPLSEAEPADYVTVASHPAKFADGP